MCISINRMPGKVSSYHIYFFCIQFLVIFLYSNVHFNLEDTEVALIHSEGEYLLCDHFYRLLIT